MAALALWTVSEKVIIGNATLYHGDCLEILPTLDKVDAVITDPPYGVMLGEAGTGAEKAKQQEKYTQFTDSLEYISSIVIPVIEKSLLIAEVGMITPGNRNAWLYPSPSDIGVWYNPAGTGRGKWGYILAHLILYYGKDPRAGKNATASSGWGMNSSVAELKNNGHPCPKPEKFMNWMVNKATTEQNQIIFDPFMGSGTTGVACMNLGRKFIGIEIEKKYFDIACERIEAAQSQGRLFK